MTRYRPRATRSCCCATWSGGVVGRPETTARGLTSAAIAKTATDVAAYAGAPFVHRFMWFALSFELQYAHHPLVFVIQNVTVEHPLSGVSVEPHDDAHGLVRRHVDGVFPAAARRRHAVAVQHLKMKTVEME